MGNTSSKFLLTISGPPASGTTSVSEYLAEKYNFKILNGGDLFREKAEEMDLTQNELVTLSEEDPQIDKDIDDRIKDRMLQYTQGEWNLPNYNGLIVDSRLAGWHGEMISDLSIYLTASPSVRQSRITNREETVDELVSREKSELQRYKEYYGVSIKNPDYYDLYLDTGQFSLSGVCSIIEQSIDDVLSCNDTGVSKISN